MSSAKFPPPLFSLKRPSSTSLRSGSIGEVTSSRSTPTQRRSSNEAISGAFSPSSLSLTRAASALLRPAKWHPRVVGAVASTSSDMLSLDVACRDIGQVFDHVCHLLEDSLPHDDEETVDTLMPLPILQSAPSRLIPRSLDVLMNRIRHTAQNSLCITHLHAHVPRLLLALARHYVLGQFPVQNHLRLLLSLLLRLSQTDSWHVRSVQHKRQKALALSSLSTSLLEMIPILSSKTLEGLRGDATDVLPVLQLLENVVVTSLPEVCRSMSSTTGNDADPTDLEEDILHGVFSTPMIRALSSCLRWIRDGVIGCDLEFEEEDEEAEELDEHLHQHDRHTSSVLSAVSSTLLRLFQYLIQRLPCTDSRGTKLVRLLVRLDAVSIILELAMAPSLQSMYAPRALELLWGLSDRARWPSLPYREEEEEGEDETKEVLRPEDVSRSLAFFLGMLKRVKEPENATESSLRADLLTLILRFVGVYQCVARAEAIQLGYVQLVDEIARLCVFQEEKPFEEEEEEEERSCRSALSLLDDQNAGVGGGCDHQSERMTSLQLCFFCCFHLTHFLAHADDEESECLDDFIRLEFHEFVRSFIDPRVHFVGASPRPSVIETLSNLPRNEDSEEIEVGDEPLPTAFEDLSPVATFLSLLPRDALREVWVSALSCLIIFIRADDLIDEEEDSDTEQENPEEEEGGGMEANVVETEQEGEESPELLVVETVKDSPLVLSFREKCGRQLYRFWLGLRDKRLDEQALFAIAEVAKTPKGARSLGRGCFVEIVGRAFDPQFLSDYRDLALCALGSMAENWPDCQLFFHQTTGMSILLRAFSRDSKLWLSLLELLRHLMGGDIVENVDDFLRCNGFTVLGECMRKNVIHQEGELFLLHSLKFLVQLMQTSHDYPPLGQAFKQCGVLISTLFRLFQSPPNEATMALLDEALPSGFPPPDFRSRVYLAFAASGFDGFEVIPRWITIDHLQLLENEIRPFHHMIELKIWRQMKLEVDEIDPTPEDRAFLETKLEKLETMKREIDRSCAELEANLLAEQKKQENEFFDMVRLQARENTSVHQIQIRKKRKLPDHIRRQITKKFLYYSYLSKQ